MKPSAVVGCLCKQLRPLSERQTALFPTTERTWVHRKYARSLKKKKGYTGKRISRLPASLPPSGPLAKCRKAVDSDLTHPAAARLIPQGLNHSSMTCKEVCKLFGQELGSERCVIIVGSFTKQQFLGAVVQATPAREDKT